MSEAAADVEQSLWEQYGDVYEEFLESDDDVLRTIAEVLKEHAGGRG